MTEWRLHPAPARARAVSHAVPHAVPHAVLRTTWRTTRRPVPRAVPCAPVHVVALAVACALPAGAARAELRWPDWTIGLGASYASDPYLDGAGRRSRPEAEPEPYLELSAGPLSISPLGAWLTVHEWPRAPAGLGGDGSAPIEESPWGLSLDLFVDVDSGYRDQGDDTVFAGMDARGADTSLGLWAEGLTPIGLFSASLATEVGGGSGGRTASLGWGVPLRSGERVEAYADVGVEWLSGALVRHDYGVRANEVRDGRPAWAPGATLVPRAGLGVEIALRPRWSLFGLLDVSRRPDAIRRSPLTDDARTDFAVEAGVLFSSD